MPLGAAKALAVDIHPVDLNYGEMQKAARRLGLHFPISSERWHCQPVEAPLSVWTTLPPGW